MAPLIGATQVTLLLQTLNDDVVKQQSNESSEEVEMEGVKCSVTYLKVSNVKGGAILKVITPLAAFSDGMEIAQNMCSHISSAIRQCDHICQLELECDNIALGLTNKLNSAKKIKDLSKALAGDLETSALFKQVVSRSRDILHADRATMFLVDSETNELYSMVADGAPTIRIPKGVGIAGHVVSSGLTVNIPDCYMDRRFNRDMDVKTGYRTRSMICMSIPDLHGEGSIGCLQLLNKLSNEESSNGSNGDNDNDDISFDADDEALLENLVGEVAVAVDHVLRNNNNSDQLNKLNSQLQEMEDRLRDSDSTSQQLLEFAKELATKSDLNEVFEEAIRDARHLVQADRATLWLVDEDTNELYTCVAEGLQALNGEVKEIRIDISKGIVGHVVCSGETFSCVDAYDCDKFNPSIDRSSGYRTRQILCVPLLSKTSGGKQKIVGAIQVVNRAEKADSISAAFSKSEEQLLVTLGEQIVGAVEHCHNRASSEAEKQQSLMQLKQMQSQLQRARTDGQALDGLLSNLSAVISGQASLQSLMDSVLDQACGLVGADRAALFILDEHKNELWTFIGKGEDAQVIRVPVGDGIAGTVAYTGETLNVTDAYLDNRFSRAADRKTGYRTRSILAAAVRNSKNKIVGVLQLINKLDASRDSVSFEASDEAIVEHFSSEIGDALESGARIEESKHKFESMQSQMASMQNHMQSQMVKTKEQAKIMIELAKGLAAADTRENLLLRVIADAKKLLGATTVVLYLHNKDTNQLCGYGDVGVTKNVSVERGMLGKVFRNNEITTKTDKDAPESEQYILYIPVQVDNDSTAQVLGVLEITSDSEFDDDDITLADAFETHVALAVNNFDSISSSNVHMLQLERKLNEATRNGAKIKELSKALAADLETSALFQQVVSRSRDILHADRATMFLVDSETNELYSMVADGAPTIRIPKGVGIAGHVVSSGLTVNIPDCYMDRRFNRDMDVKTGYHTSSMICVPIPDLHGAGSVGCLQLLNKLPTGSENRSDATPFHEDDEALLENLVNEVAIAVDHMSQKNKSSSQLARLNAQLMGMETRLKETGSSSQHLLEFAKELATKSEVNEIFAEAIKEARVLVHADRATLWLVDEETNELFTCVAQGMDVQHGTVKEIRIGIGTGIVGHVVCSGELFSCADACKFCFAVAK